MVTLVLLVFVVWCFECSLYLGLVLVGLVCQYHSQVIGWKDLSQVVS